MSGESGGPSITQMRSFVLCTCSNRPPRYTHCGSHGHLSSFILNYLYLMIGGSSRRAKFHHRSNKECILTGPCRCKRCLPPQDWNITTSKKTKLGQLWDTWVSRTQSTERSDWGSVSLLKGPQVALSTTVRLSSMLQLQVSILNKARANTIVSFADPAT